MTQLLRSAVATTCLLIILCFACTKKSFADVTLTTQTVAAANLTQGSNDNIVYVVKMGVTVAPVTVNNIQFTLDGTYDNNDLTGIVVYFNPTAPNVSGAQALVGTTSTFSAPHLFNLGFAINQPVAASSSGYFIIAVNLASGATPGNTIKVNGATNPVVFGFTSSPVVTNNQTDLAGVQTIIGGAVTLTSSPVAASNIAQGASNVLAYVVKMDVAGVGVTANNMQFTLGGTYDNNDLSTVGVYFNATAPTLSGAINIVNFGVGFASPHTYSGGINQPIAAGGSGYFIIVFGLSATATPGNTIKIDGLANPVIFNFSTGPSVTNNQTDAAGVQTIIGGAVTLTSSPVAASNIAQGASNVLAYVVKMDVAGVGVTANNMQFTLGGTYDNNDLSTVGVYFNATAPTLSGAINIVNFGVGFASPHTYSGGINQPIAAGNSGYFIIVFGLSATATPGNTIKIDGLANPVIFNFSTGPSVTNNQTDAAGVQTIIGGAVTLTSSPVAASNIAQGASNVLAYVVKMDVAGVGVTANNMHFTLGGTYDNNDLSTVGVYFNATAPTLSGAINIVNFGVGFASPHTYSGGINQPIAAGNSGYFIIVFGLSATATPGNTIKIDGLANPVIFNFSTGPSVTNNQTDAAGVQTIIGGAVTLTSSPVAASNIAQGASNVLAYVVKMDVAGVGVTANNMQFTLGGTYDNNDLSTVGVYFNATAPTLSGAINIVNFGVGFASPHTYSGGINQPIAAGNSGYFIIVFGLSATATPGNTIKIDGLANPVIFNFSTGPSVTNNQTDIAGIQTILAAGVTLTSSTVPASNIAQGSTNNLVYAIKMDVTNLPVSVNNIQFTLTGTHDNNDLSVVGIWFNATAASLTGATLLSNPPGTFAAPHTYSIPLSQPIAAGATGYFLITVNLDAAATAGNTVILNGAVNPVVFGFTTAPPVTNNQTNAAGTQTFISLLPLTLTSFTGSLVNSQQTYLQWETAGELNTKDFELEWSSDGVNFITIATLAAANNSIQNKQYHYLHQQPVDGNNFYRLKMNDRDGRLTYSSIVKIKAVVTITKVAVFPNPVAEVMQLRFQAAKGETVILYLHSADGKTIASKSVALAKGNNSIPWNIGQLAAGNYYITSANNSIEAIKIIKQ